MLTGLPLANRRRTVGEPVGDALGLAVGEPFGEAVGEPFGEPDGDGVGERTTPNVPENHLSVLGDLNRISVIDKRHILTVIRIKTQKALPNPSTRHLSDQCVIDGNL